MVAAFLVQSADVACALFRSCETLLVGCSEKGYGEIKGDDSKYEVTYRKAVFQDQIKKSAGNKKTHKGAEKSFGIAFASVASK